MPQGYNVTPKLVVFDALGGYTEDDKQKGKVKINSDKVIEQLEAFMKKHNCYIDIDVRGGLRFILH